VLEAAHDVRETRVHEHDRPVAGAHDVALDRDQPAVLVHAERAEVEKREGGGGVQA
jgi:hypothetical protein